MTCDKSETANPLRPSQTGSADLGPYETALRQFDDAAEALDLDDDIRAVLRVAKRELVVNFPVEMDDGATVAVQGAGNVGLGAVRMFHDDGFRVVAVSDSRGGAYRESGLDPDAVERHRAEGGPMAELPGTDPLTNGELLELPVDVLAPSAIEGQLTSENASRVKASLIVEGANGPTTPAADAEFADRDITVVPDILANAGGVTVSYFEWVQDLQQFFWTEAEITDRLGRQIRHAYEAVSATAERHDVTLRRAAHMLAISRVAEATSLRGIYP